jgi:hypothetical protein
MEDTGERGRDKPDALDERGTWFAQQLGEGWTEVEPGIYRFDGGVRNEHGIRVAPAAEPAAWDDLLDALQSPGAQAEPPNPTRRLLGRKAPG